MIPLIAAALLSAEAAASAPVCYTSDDQIVLIASADQSAAAFDKLQRAPCPAEFSWTAKAALDLCAFYAHYDVIQQYYFAELYGVSTTQVCNQGRIAAGLPPKPETPPE